MSVSVCLKISLNTAKPGLSLSHYLFRFPPPKAWQLVALESLVGFDATDVLGLGGTFTDESNDDDDDDEDEEATDSDATPNGSPRRITRRNGVKTREQVAAREKEKAKRKTEGVSEPAPPKNRQLCLETMKTVVKNVVVKTFRFPTSSGESWTR